MEEGDQGLMRDAASSALLFDVPMAMRPRALNSLLVSIAPRLSVASASNIKLKTPAPRASAIGGHSLPGGAWHAGGGIAVLPILGPIMRRPSWLSQACGFTTYQSITDSLIDLATMQEVRGVLLEIDSPGGEASGCSDAAELMRKVRLQTGKPVWAIANDCACSAAYALASSASRIWLTRTAEVGSIGVVCAHIDQSARDEKVGLKWTYIFAGEHKTHGNPHEPLAAEAYAAAKRDVDDLQTMFVKLVSQHRKMTPSAVRATKADTFRGNAAVRVGLADRVGTFDECIEAFAERVRK